MRWAIASLLLFIGVFSDTALAQSAPLIRAFATHVIYPGSDNDQIAYNLRCPAGYIPAGLSIARQYRFDIDTELRRDLVDRNNAVIAPGSMTTAAQVMGGGYAGLLYNDEHHVKNVQVMMTCVAVAVTTDNAVTLVKSTSTAPTSAPGTAISFCPADFPVALGGFSNADVRAQLQDAGSAPVWGTAADPVFLRDMPDGQTGPPTGWQIRVLNLNFFTTKEIVGVAVCGKVPALQTFIYSVSVPQAAFGIKAPFSIFAPVPDGWTAVGSGFAGGRDREFWYGEYISSDIWTEDGIVVDMLQWFASSKGYDSGTSEVRAFMTHALGSAPSGGARAMMAVLAVPEPAPAPTSVTIVEYYNAQLDHYFITAIPDEIAKLDNGTFVGWVRTGQTFEAYGIGSAGRTGRRPVCRAYGNPDAFLNSHFYSASPDECNATLVNGGGFSWLLEASEVFQMDLPDPVTGACPDGGVPIYRVFNQRRDANHRYTTSIAIREQMVAKGGVAEGYGPNAVALCGLL